MSSRISETISLHRYSDSHASEHQSLLDHSTSRTPPRLPPPRSAPAPASFCFSIITWIPLLLLLIAVATYIVHYPALREGHSIGGSQLAGWRPSPLSTQPPSPFSPSSLWKPLPEQRALLPSVCGNWTSSYQQFHASVSSGQWFVQQFLATGAFPPPPLLVFHIDVHSTTGGISDRWPILSTAMVVAVLTERAVFFDWPGYEKAYTHPNLPGMVHSSWQAVYDMWRWYEGHKDQFTQLRSANEETAMWPKPPPFVLSAFHPPPADHLLHSLTHDYKLLFREDHTLTPVVSEIPGLRELRALYPPTKPVVYFQAAYGGKGLTHYFYQSPGLRGELMMLGLRQAQCHGCMINFVLGLSNEVKRKFEPFASQLRPQDVLTVGIQMRMGDTAMVGDRALTEKNKADIAWQLDDEKLVRHAGNFLKCAEQLVALHVEAPHHPTLYFIVSDSVRMREALQRTLSNSTELSVLIIPSGDEFKVGHTDSGDKSLYSDSSALKVEDLSRYLQVAAGEQWLLAWCDYLVIDHMASGFGRSAALRSLRVGRAWDGRSHNKRCDADTGALTVQEYEQIGHKY